MKNIFQLLKPTLFVLLIFCGSNTILAQEKGIITGGIQSPGINNAKAFTKNILATTPPNQTDNKTLNLTPYIKYRKTLKKDYVDIMLALTIDRTKNSFESTTNSQGKYSTKVEDITTRIAYLEVGKGMKFPVKKSFITVGLNGLAGYDFGSSTNTVEKTLWVDNTNVNKTETDYQKDRVVILGIATDCTYNQHLSKNFMVTLEPKLTYSYQFNVTKPKQSIIVTNNEVVTSETEFEYVEWSDHKTAFRFIPTFGLTYKY